MNAYNGTYMHVTIHECPPKTLPVPKQIFFTKSKNLFYLLVTC